MRFSAEWLDGGASVSAELRATDCFLEIRVGKRQVSRFVDNRTDRAHNRIVMPAYPTAEELARNWWSLVAGRTQEFCLRRFRDGFVLPDVRIRPDGRFMNISVEPFEYRNPPVSFTVRSRERIAIGEFERDAGAFIEATLDRLSEEAVPDTWLQERWDSICESQEDVEEMAFCVAAGALGVDPYTCPDDEAELVEVSSGSLAEDALPEFLAGCKPDRILKALSWMEESEVSLGSRAALPELPEVATDIRHDLLPGLAEERAWKVGYEAAAACRKRLSLSAIGPFQDPPEIARMFGACRFEVCDSRVNGLRAEVNGDTDYPRVVVAGPGHSSSLNFATMRAIGDYLVYGSRGRAPVNDTHSYRQAVGRAFAAEMLVPADVIAEMQDQGMGIDEIAAERNVSEMTVMHHLENHLRPEAVT